MLLAAIRIPRVGWWAFRRLRLTHWSLRCIVLSQGIIRRMPDKSGMTNRREIMLACRLLRDSLARGILHRRRPWPKQRSMFPAQEKLETRQGKCQACTEEGRKAHDAETGKVQGPACGPWCPKTRAQEKAVTQICGKGTKKSAKTSGGGASRGHDHRRDRGAGPWRCCRYGVRIDWTATPISSSREPKGSGSPENDEQ